MRRDKALRRAFDLALSAVSLVLLAPLLAAVALAVLIHSGKPILFRQLRLGLEGRPFSLLKFRTIRATANSDVRIAAAGDARVTRIGRILRRSKLDELPQLINILRGDMSFVGPRPELPVFVDLSNEAWREVLGAKPGLVDPASLAWSNEAEVLASHSNPIAAYRQLILPKKLAVSRVYLRQRTLWKDLKLIVQAAWRALRLRL